GVCVLWTRWEADARGSVRHVPQGLYPSYRTYLDHRRGTRLRNTAPVVRDVCRICNNELLSKLDGYVANLNTTYFSGMPAPERPITFEYALAAIVTARVASDLGRALEQADLMLRSDQGERAGARVRAGSSSRCRRSGCTGSCRS